MKIQDIPITTHELSWGKVTLIQSIPDMLGRNLLFPESSSPENQRSIKDVEITLIHSRLVRLKSNLDHHRPTLCQRILEFITFKFLTIWRLRRSLPAIIAHIDAIKRSIWRHKFLLSLEKAKSAPIELPPQPQPQPVFIPVPASPKQIIVREIQYKSDLDELKKFQEKIMIDVRKELSEIIDKAVTNVQMQVSPSPTPPRRKSPPQTLQIVKGVTVVTTQRDSPPNDDIVDCVVVTPIQGSPRKTNGNGK